MTSVVASQDTTVLEDDRQCRDCQKVFKSQKSLSRHESKCKSRKRVTGKPPTSSEGEKGPAPPAVKNSFIAYECELCSRLFKSKESLVSHRAEHSDIDAEYSEEEEDLVNSDVDEDKTADKALVPKADIMILKKKSDLLEDARKKECFLKMKLQTVQNRVSNYVSDLKNKALNIDQISLRKEMLDLKLIKLKTMIEKKEARNPVVKPDENRKNEVKTKTAKRKSQTSISKTRKKFKITESPVVESKDPKVNVSMLAYKELTIKNFNLASLESRFSFLKSKLEKVKQLGLVREGEQVKTEPLSPEKDDVFDRGESEEITNEQTEDTEDLVKPANKFQALKSKLERQLVRRSKINSQIEKMIGDPEAVEEEAERRLKARLAREATVKEVMRRQEERRQLERDKELQQQEEKLVIEIQELKEKIQELGEDSKSPDCSRKKSRRELRKHLQGKIDPKASLSMSLETRLKTILELQEEKSWLTQRLEEIKMPQQVVVKIEDSLEEDFDEQQDKSQTESLLQEHEVKQEVKEEPVFLEVDVSDSESEEDEDYSALEHFVTDKEAFRQLMLRKYNFDTPEQSEDHAVGAEEDNDEISKLEEDEMETSFLIHEIIDDILKAALVEAAEVFVEEKKDRDTNEECIENKDCLEAIADLLDDVMTRVSHSDIEEKGVSDILNRSWAEADKFVEVLSQDESPEEEDLIRTFESGELTRSVLMESLPSLGWVSRHDQAEFLPPDWFMKMDTTKYLQTGIPSFFFITDTLDICLSSEDAVEYMSKCGHYSKQEIVQFEEHFGL